MKSQKSRMGRETHWVIEFTLCPKLRPATPVSFLASLLSKLFLKVINVFRPLVPVFAIIHNMVMNPWCWNLKPSLLTLFNMENGENLTLVSPHFHLIFSLNIYKLWVWTFKIFFSFSYELPLVRSGIFWSVIPLDWTPAVLGRLCREEFKRLLLSTVRWSYVVVKRLYFTTGWGWFRFSQALWPNEAFIDISRDIL